VSEHGWIWEKEVRGAVNQVSVVEGPARIGETFAEHFLCRLIHWRFTLTELGERRLARTQPPQRTIDRTADDGAVIGVIKEMLEASE